MTGDQTTFGQLHSGRVNDPQPATTEYESLEDQLSRAVYENGFASDRNPIVSDKWPPTVKTHLTRDSCERKIGDGPWESVNFIEVWRSSDNLINILCGHCDQVVSPKINSGHFCCHFAANMYRRYFEDKLVRR